MAEDSSGYPDCRPEYYAAFNRVIAAGTKPETQLEIVTPVISMRKSEIVRRGLELGAPFEAPGRAIKGRMRRAAYAIVAPCACGLSKRLGSKTPYLMPAALNTAGTPRRSWFVEIDIAEIVRNALLKIGECCVIPSPAGIPASPGLQWAPRFRGGQVSEGGAATQRSRRISMPDTTSLCPLIFEYIGLS